AQELFVDPLDGVFLFEVFPSIVPRGVGMDCANSANQRGARRIGLKLIVHVQAGLHGTVEARRVGMNRSPGLWVLAFVCLVLVLASSMMNVTDPRPVASDPTAPPWSVLGDPVFTFGYGGELGGNGSHAPTAPGTRRADLANLSFFLALGDLSYSTQSG